MLCREGRLRLTQELTQLLLHGGPLRRYDRIAHRGTGNVVSGHPMGSENPVELTADAFERSPRTLVTRAGVKANPEHLPCFEGVRQHEQLRLGVGCGPDCRARQPRVTDLTDIGVVAPMPRVAVWPRPSLQVKEACRPDDDTVIRAIVRAVVHPVLQFNDREWHRAAGVPPSQSGVDVARRFDLALRDGTPLVERGVRCRGGHQAFDVTVFKRFETNVLTPQHNIFCSHACQYAVSPWGAAIDSRPHDSSREGHLSTCFAESTGNASVTFRTFSDRRSWSRSALLFSCRVTASPGSRSK